ncbi:MAG: 3-phosphoshikimate 1-carboxyvinyltransferase [Microscillaceae bacterium]|nr:3-phosphoshikimate 1-carboxyvinyltransferase [Microscillaceae bacterium]MDW8459934.1 3-phosphoshikimate 1-carboxyvinyltransferase [Cytophagales bacterium]
MLVTIALPASKSESNRALMLEALAHFQAGQTQNTSRVQNLSSARDTQIMYSLLHTQSKESNVHDAGTVMRFLVAYFAVTNRTQYLYGTERMHQRPIGVLVDALNSLGFEVHYTNKIGYPPVRVQAISPKRYAQIKHEVAVRGDVSSQYISALLMIAPLLPKGLVINLLGEVISQPYIAMTIQQMQYFGVQTLQRGNLLQVAPQRYQVVTFHVEADWSAASYWYSFLAILAWKKQFLGLKIKLVGLKSNSLQGDSVIKEVMQKWGIFTTFDNQGALLSFHPSQCTPPKLVLHCTHCPDLVQTFAVCAALLQTDAEFSGIESLRIKETDRIIALQNELAKIGVSLKERNSKWYLDTQNLQLPKTIFIQTYQDHRMAMAFAVLGVFCDLEVEQPQVVSKSYPHFWADVQLLFSTLQLPLPSFLRHYGHE